METSGEQIGSEGCLSFPGYSGFVKRAKYIKVISLNRKGEGFTLEAEDMLARCIQHEMDHLNGVLFIDHVQDRFLYHDETGQRISLFDVQKLTR